MSKVLSRTFRGGVLGAAMMSVLAGMLFWMSIPFFRIEVLLGSWITGSRDGALTWTLGFIWHLLNGGIFALLYFVVFKLLARPNAFLGALMGVLHWAVAGVVLSMILDLKGFAWRAWGITTFYESFFLHLAYGATVGLVCRTNMLASVPLALPTPDERRTAA